MLLHLHFTKFSIMLNLNSISFWQKCLLQKWNACGFTDLLIILFYTVFRNSRNQMWKALQFNAYIQHCGYSTVLHAIKMEYFLLLFIGEKKLIKDGIAGNECWFIYTPEDIYNQLNSVDLAHFISYTLMPPFMHKHFGL